MLKLIKIGGLSNDKTLYRDVVGDIQPIFDFDDLNEIPAVFPPFHFEELKELLEKLSRCSYPGVVDLNKQQQYIKEFFRSILYYYGLTSWNLKIFS